ncbi:hypothetical protein BOX15_Mlig033165g1, partial [Macrostomum lignano]
RDRMEGIHFPINWRNLPIDELGNVDSFELNFISETSNIDRRDDELPCLDGEQLDVNEMDRVEIESLPAETRKQMYIHGERFLNFLASEKLRDVSEVPAETLNQNLKYFYFKLKRQDGNSYSLLLARMPLSPSNRAYALPASIVTTTLWLSSISMDAPLINASSTKFCETFVRRINCS